MDIREHIERELERVANKMKATAPGSTEYQELLKEVERLTKLMNDEDRLELDKLDSQAKRDLDEDKQRLAETESERNYELEKEKARADQASAASDRDIQNRDSIRGLVKSLIGAAAMLTMGVVTINCEETRIITSKAWSFVSKVLPKI